MELSGNTILITGGASGIGLALAQAFLENQNTVIICGRDPSKLARAAAQHQGLITRVVDLTRADALAEFARTIQHEFPRLNILVNNAGIQNAIDLKDATIDSDSIRKELEINLTAPIVLTHLLLPRLLTQANAAIINVTSALAIAPKRSAPIYCTSKAGLRLFTRVLRYQMKATKTRVFEVIPALVETPMTGGRPTKGMISPERVARDVLRGLANNREQITVERTRALCWLHRWWPTLAYRLLENQ